jgi:hypothetical protein
MRHEDLLLLGEDLALGPRWRALAARATAAGERRWLVVPLRRRLLVATADGRARLRRWIDRQRAAPAPVMPEWLLRAWVGERLLYVGAPSLHADIVTALTRVPAAVREHVLAECAFEEVGGEGYGWYGATTLQDRAGQTRPGCIRLSGAPGHRADFVKHVLHEIGHCWYSPSPTLLVSAAGELGVRQLARQQGWLAQAEARREREERACDAFADAWAP